MVASCGAGGAFVGGSRSWHGTLRPSVRTLQPLNRAAAAAWAGDTHLRALQRLTEDGAWPQPRAVFAH